MVPHRQVPAAFADIWLQPPVERDTSVGLEVEVKLDDEVETCFRNPDVKVGDDEFNVETALGCGLASTLNGHGAEVDGGDLPALCGEPQSIRTLATGDVECSPRLHVRDDFRELPVRVA